MDALELGNDSGSLSASRNRRHSPQARGGLRGWTQRLGLDKHGLDGALDPKEDSDRVRARREIEESFFHPPPILLTGRKTLLWIPWTWTQSLSNRRCRQPTD